jgi:hypothetical protein
MKPLRLFVPITRTEKREDGLLVEGYCYVNEKVPSDRYNLKRSAMEAASPDFAFWGNIREMHSPSAAGTSTADGCGIEWDERGCFMRALVVDTEAIKKVETGVYKGFSVGVQPTVVRGSDVEKCTWYETSLVDRPADPDAMLSIARAAGAPADGTDAEAAADVYDEGDELPADVTGDEDLTRGAFAIKIAARETGTLRGLAFDTLYCLLYDLCNSNSADVEAEARQVCAEFADYVVPLVAARTIPQELEYGAGLSADLLTRFADTTRDSITLRSEQAAALTRAETAERDLATVRGELAAARERVLTLERSADPTQRKPVRIPQALDRNFTPAGQEPASAEIATLQEELTRLSTETQNEPDAEKRKANVTRMQVIKMKLAESPDAA